MRILCGFSGRASGEASEEFSAASGVEWWWTVGRVFYATTVGERRRGERKVFYVGGEGRRRLFYAAPVEEGRRREVGVFYAAPVGEREKGEYSMPLQWTKGGGGGNGGVFYAAPVDEGRRGKGECSM